MTSSQLYHKVTPEIFAELTCDDYNLPFNPCKDLLVNSIKNQINDYLMFSDSESKAEESQEKLPYLLGLIQVNVSLLVCTEYFPLVRYHFRLHTIYRFYLLEH